jgi:hypothetical protein
MWVKEIDDIYLLPGAFGIIGSVNRVEGITHRFTKIDIVGPRFRQPQLYFDWSRHVPRQADGISRDFRPLAVRQPHQARADPFIAGALRTGGGRRCRGWRSGARSGMEPSSTRRYRRVFGPVAQPDRATVS